MDATPPRWRTALPRNGPAPALRAWLTEPRSLTRRMRRRCAGGFSVRLLALYRQRPGESERRLLGSRHGQLALVREVALACAGHPLVYARTVIPLPTLRGPYRRLRRLGNRPLADVLFTARGVRRDAMEFALVLPGQDLHQRAAAVLEGGEDGLWARRSRFLLRRRPLLVTEVFAPELAHD